MDLTRLNLPVGLVLSTFTTLYCTAVFGVIIPVLDFSVPGVTNLGILTLSTSLALFSYCCCVFLNAGSVPDSWVPDLESLSQTLEVKRKGNTARFCQKCTNYKPPRAHHCRVCNQCVLRMDHHCVWINNCVGHNNYKSFILFLIYAVAALVHVILIMGGAVVEQQANLHPVSHRVRPVTPENTLMHQFLFSFWKVICLTGTMVLATALSLLLAWHLYLIYFNKTTIEYHEGVRARGLSKSHTHPYDLGVCGNLHSILGANASCWLLPIECSVAGDGVEYEVWDGVVSKLSGTSLHTLNTAPSKHVDHS
jgi:palmitoyltransferase